MKLLLNKAMSLEFFSLLVSIITKSRSGILPITSRSSESFPSSKMYVEIPRALIEPNSLSRPKCALPLFSAVSIRSTTS